MGASRVWPQFLPPPSMTGLASSSPGEPHTSHLKGRDSTFGPKLLTSNRIHSETLNPHCYIVLPSTNKPWTWNHSTCIVVCSQVQSVWSESQRLCVWVMRLWSCMDGVEYSPAVWEDVCPQSRHKHRQRTTPLILAPQIPILTPYRLGPHWGENRLFIRVCVCVCVCVCVYMTCVCRFLCVCVSN